MENVTYQEYKAEQRRIDDALKHQAVLLGEYDRRVYQRFEDSDKAVQAALQAAEKAVGKAEIAQEKRNETTNEFRGQLADQAATLMPRREAELRLEDLRKNGEDLKDDLGDLRTVLTELRAQIGTTEKTGDKLRHIGDTASTLFLTRIGIGAAMLASLAAIAVTLLGG